jgi:hypothetical protein
MAAKLTILVAVALVFVAGPFLLAAIRPISARRAPSERILEPAKPWDWKLTVHSALLYALAFNVTFFIQEFFLVLPKALTPGLRPTLFHNNHTWQGENPLASLFQGTGALAIFLSAIACSLLLRRKPRSSTVRLFLIWMTYNGVFQSLPQVVIGAVRPQNDVGMAMDYLGLGANAKTAAALTAIVMMPLVALWLVRPLLSLADDSGWIVSSRARARFIFHVATLPSLAAIPLIVLFRIPREWIEVFVVPTVVTVIGIAWMQAGAGRVNGAMRQPGSGLGQTAYPLGALAVLLLVFQLVLRQGIRFY